MSFQVVSPSGVANVGMGDVRVLGADQYTSLFIWSDNSSTVATSTVKSFDTLTKYYAANGLKTKLYGAGAKDANWAVTMRYLSIEARLCNPLVMWIQNKQLITPYISRATPYSPADLDALLRSGMGVDPALRNIPLYGSTPATSTGSASSSGSTTSTSASGSSTTSPFVPVDGSGDNSSTTSPSSGSTLAPLPPSSSGSASAGSGSSGPTVAGDISTTSTASGGGTSSAQLYGNGDTAAQKSSNDMSAGGKAGISIAAIIGTAALAFLAYWYYNHRKRNTQVRPVKRLFN